MWASIPADAPVTSAAVVVDDGGGRGMIRPTDTCLRRRQWLVDALTPDRMWALLPVCTERLVVRAPAPRTTSTTSPAMKSDPQVVRWVPYEPRTRDKVASRLAETLDPPPFDADARHRQLAVQTRQGEFVGELTLILASVADGRVEVGYRLPSPQQGHGYATEALRALLGPAFDGLGAHRAIAQSELLNPASARVMRRCGMRREALFWHHDVVKGEWPDLEVHALLAQEWREGSSSIPSLERNWTHPDRRRGAGAGML